MQIMNFEKTVPYRHKNGLLGFLQLLWHNAIDLAILSVLLILFSLPVFTASAAITAMCEVCTAISADRPVLAVRDFISAFFRRLRGEPVSAIIWAGVLLLGAAGFVCYWHWRTVTPLFLVLAVAALCAEIVCALAAVAYYPLRAAGYKSTLVVAVRLSVNRLDCTFPALLGWLIPIVIIASLLPYSLPMIVFVPAVGSLAATYSLRKAIA